MIAEPFVDVFLDPVHWAIEGVAEIMFFALEILVLDYILHRVHPIIRSRHGRRMDHRRRR